MIVPTSKNLNLFYKSPYEKIMREILNKFSQKFQNSKSIFKPIRKFSGQNYFFLFFFHLNLKCAKFQRNRISIFFTLKFKLNFSKFIKKRPKIPKFRHKIRNIKPIRKFSAKPQILKN